MKPLTRYKWVAGLVALALTTVLVCMLAPWSSTDSRSWALSLGVVVGAFISWGRCTSPGFLALPSAPTPIPVLTGSGRAWFWDVGLALAPVVHGLAVVCLVMDVRSARSWPWASGLMLATPLLWSPLLFKRLTAVLAHLGVPHCLDASVRSSAPLWRRCARLHALAGVVWWKTFWRLPWFGRLLMGFMSLLLAAHTLLLLATAALVAYSGHIAYVWAIPFLLVLVGTPCLLLLLTIFSSWGTPGIVAVQETGQRWQDAWRAREAASALARDLPAPPPTASPGHRRL